MEIDMPSIISMDDFPLHLAKIIAFVCAKVAVVCTPCSSLKVLRDDDRSTNARMWQMKGAGLAC